MKLISYNTSYCLIEVVTKGGFTIICCSLCVVEEMKVCQVFWLFVIFKMTVMFTFHYLILINDLDGLRPLTSVHKLSHSPLTWICTVIPSASSTNKTDCHDTTEILLKVTLNTITLTLVHYYLWLVIREITPLRNVYKHNNWNRH